jgi:hypothetical protein
MRDDWLGPPMQRGGGRGKRSRRMAERRIGGVNSALRRMQLLLQ